MTSVPPHVLVLTAKMKELIRKFKELRVDIKEDFTSTLDSGGMGWSEYQTNQILEEIRETGSTTDMNSAVFYNSSLSALVSTHKEG